MIFSLIKNIIFDWGGVITDLCYECCRNKFLELGVKDFSKNYMDLLSNPIFSEFETGKISENQFREFIRSNSTNQLTNDDIDNAWCKMLGDTPTQRIELLQNLNKRYKTILMSNTNNIHVRYYTNYLKEKFGLDSFENIFHKVYFSHIIGLRKPDKKFFEYILEENKLNPSETLFLDDSPQNIESASSIGINSILITKNNPIEKLFNNKNLQFS